MPGTTESDHTEFCELNKGSRCVWDMTSIFRNPIFRVNGFFHIRLKMKGRRIQYTESVPIEETTQTWHMAKGRVSLFIPLTKHFVVEDPKKVVLEVNDFGMIDNPGWTLKVEDGLLCGVQYQQKLQWSNKPKL